MKRRHLALGGLFAMASGVVMMLTVVRFDEPMGAVEVLAALLVGVGFVMTWFGR